MKRSFLPLALALMLCTILLPSCMSAHEHTYSDAWSSDADAHYHAATCWHTDERRDVTEHTWDDGVLLERPQEFTEGKIRYTCTVCEAQTVDVIPMLHVHTYADELSFDEQEHYYAATCGCKNVRRDATAHELTASVTDPTCLADGYTTHSCACGYTFTDTPTDATGHDFTIGYTNEDGTHTLVCQNKSSHIKAERCTYDSATVTDPTCTEDGYTTHTCACGHSYTDNVVAAIGHAYDAWVSLQNGTHMRACQNDPSHTQVQDCSYSVTVIEPTCTEDGYTVSTCFCGRFERMDGTLIQALGHSFVDHVCTTCLAAESATLAVDEVTSPVYLVSQTVIDYMEAPYYTCITSLPTFASMQGQDLGRGVTLSYTISGDTYGAAVASATLTLTSVGPLSDDRVITLTNGATSAELYNLLTGTEYRFRFDIVLASGAKLSNGGSFRTAKTPRLMNIGGMSNVRDVGGWQTVDGQTVRQGLLYRGTEMDGKVASWHLLNEQGREVMRNLLGIRTDMDLRNAQDILSDVSVLGEDVTLYYYDAVQYEDIFTEEGKANMRAIFADLADPDNYPIYLHCTYGSDRTGTVCLLLEGLLGVSRGNAVRDYELSALVYDSKTRDAQLTELLAGIDAMEGNTFQKKIENYLLSAGVTAEQIQSIRDIFLK